MKLWVMLHCTNFPIGYTEWDTLMAPLVAVTPSWTPKWLTCRLKMGQYVSWWSRTIFLWIEFSKQTGKWLIYLQVHLLFLSNCTAMSLPFWLWASHLISPIFRSFIFKIRGLQKECEFSWHFSSWILASPRLAGWESKSALSTQGYHPIMEVSK